MRSDEWWPSKPPLMLAIAYGQLGAPAVLVPVGTALEALALFILATVGLAGIGYVLNDFGDRESDRLSGHRNAVLEAGTGWSLVGIFVLAMLAVAPWFLLPTSPPVAVLLGLELALLAAYALPPLRLKARGGAGIVCDACYGYVVPLLVPLLLFGEVAHHPPGPAQIVLVGAWSLVLGVRHVLEHQLEDAGRDARDGTPTFVARRGWTAAHRLFDRVTLTELALLGPALLTFGRSAPVLLVAFALHAAWVCLRPSAKHLGGRVSLRAGSAIIRARMLGWDVMTDFHLDLLAPLLAAALLARDGSYVLVLMLQLLIFERPLRRLLRRGARRRRRARAYV